MTTFQNAGVFINSFTGLIAQSVTISNSNNLTSSSSVGSRNGSMIPNGPIKTDLVIEYTPKILSDPILNEIVNVNNLINLNQLYTENQVPLVVQVSNISGSFFLSNFKLNISTNNIINASVSFVSFGQISGFGTDRATSSISASESQIGHAWSTSIADDSSTEYNVNLYAAEYGFSKALNPIYKLGSKEPIQVLCGQISRNVSFTFENFYTVDYSGISISDIFNNNGNLKIRGYNSLEYRDSEDGFEPTTNVSGDEVLLSIKNMKITKTTTPVQFNDIIKTTVQAESII